MLINALIEEEIRAWLKEDISFGDVSTNFIERRRVMGRILSKQAGKISGIEVVKLIFKLMNVEFRESKSDGEEVLENEDIMVFEGDVHDILASERTALNILTHLSGITTYVNELIKKISSEGLNLKIAGTRKTLPGLRKFEKYAIQIAGGDTHRMNLSSMILLKENHISQFPSIKHAVLEARKHNSFSLKIEVEARTEEEAIDSVHAEADIVMLDNFNPSELIKLVPKLKEINPNILTEASGNITEANILEYAKSGVDIVSLGKITHSVKAFDMSLLLDDVHQLL